MPLYEVEVIATAYITELWRLYAADAEDAAEDYGMYGEFIEQISVDGERDREVVSVEKIDPKDAVPAQSVRDELALNEMAAYLRKHESWNGGDFCELAAIAIQGTGRKL